MSPSTSVLTIRVRPARAAVASALAVAALLAGATASASISATASAAEVATSTTLFGSVVPAVVSDVDRKAVELGMRFTSDVPGQVEGVRFYKGAANTGTHIGSLWSGGVRVATATFTSETASGWQTVRFATPVKISAGATYVASYWAPRGRYAVAEGYFAQPRVAAPLRATAGTYRYGGGYPSSTYRSSNYYVDVAFTPAASAAPVVPAPTSAPTAPAPTAAPTAPAPAAPTPSAPAPATPSTGFPGAGNTGVPAGTPLRASSSLVLSTPNAVVEGLDVTGTVQINASGVTLRRSRVTSGRDFSVIRVKEGVTGVRIEDVTINGLGGTSNSMGVMGPASVVRANISGVENGFTPSSGSVLRDSWIHDLRAPGSPHYDGVQIDGGQSNILLQHNTIDLREWSQTAAIMIDNWFGPIDTIRVDGNRLLGAGYTVYSDGQFTGGSIRNVSFTNNRFVRGTWGYGLLRNNATTPVWTGNVNDVTGATVTP